MALAFQSSTLPLKPQLFSPPHGKRHARSIIASSTKQNSPHFQRQLQIVTSKALQLALSGALALGISLSGAQLVEAKLGVNKPELLPKEFTTVIDVAGFLSAGQVKEHFL